MIIIIAIPVVFFILMQIMNITHADPPSSTQPDTVNIEDLKGRVRGVSTLRDEERYHVDPIEFKASTDEAMQLMKQILLKYPRSKLKRAEDNYLYVTITSPVWRFIDDIEVLYIPEEELYHFRSGPRFGKTDLGVNRERFYQIKSKITGEPIEETNLPQDEGVNREQIPAKELKLLIIGSAICSAMIIGSYLIWLAIIPDFFEKTGIATVIIAIILTTFSSTIVLMLLRQKSFKSMVGPTLGWIVILIVFSIWSQIYLIIPVAIVQLLIDLKFYRLVDRIAETS